MTRVTFIHPTGSVSCLDAENGVSLMQAAVGEGIEGIVAECGGSAMCATCHVYVDEAFLGRLPEPTDDEDEMLECTASPREACSRLSCQLVVTPEFDGIVLRLPEAQLS
jgi:ferredoxin, 2Fe-2S